MIKYIADSVEWRDKTYANTYCSTRIAENMNFDNLYETSQPGTRKQAEQWGKL